MGWDTIGLILIGLEHYGMGHNRTDTDRTGTLWDTAGLILIGLEHYGIQ